MTIISGHDLVHVLEALVVGMALKKTITRRRICFVNDVPRQMELLLHTVWEIKNFTDLGLHGFSGASKRLSKIHSMLLALWWLADEAEAVVMLDANLYIKHSLDGAFFKLTHSEVAGAYSRHQ